MAAATLTTKGQITIPVSVRDALQLMAGDRIEFIDLGERRFAIVPATLPASALKGLIRKPAKPVSIDEMNKAIVEYAARRG